MYENTTPNSNHRFGYRYECLNEKFFLYPPIKFKDTPEILLVTFGGVDQNNLTKKILKSAKNILEETSLEKIIAVIGGGYTHQSDLEELINQNSQIELYRKVDNMPELMSKADIAITSNGRTIYELTAMGIPTISIAQNDRETLHLFARYNHGINYLGIACTVSDDDIIDSIKDVLNGDGLRRKMYNKQIEFSNTIRNGLTNIIDEITSNYWKWKHEQKDS